MLSTASMSRSLMAAGLRLIWPTPVVAEEVVATKAEEVEVDTKVEEATRVAVEVINREVMVVSVILFLVIRLRS